MILIELGLGLGFPIPKKNSGKCPCFLSQTSGHLTLKTTETEFSLINHTVGVNGVWKCPHVTPYSLLVGSFQQALLRNIYNMKCVIWAANVKSVTRATAILHCIIPDWHFICKAPSGGYFKHMEMSHRLPIDLHTEFRENLGCVWHTLQN